jgi:hypothetical protein
MRPHPRIRKTVKWGGPPAVALLLYAWPLNGAFHVGGVRLSSGDADLLLFALLTPLALATVAAWILDEIVIPAGTPADPVKLQGRMRRAARATTTLCLWLHAAGATYFAVVFWRQASSLPPGFTANFRAQAAWLAGAAVFFWCAGAASVYLLRPRHGRPGCCAACGYSRTGLAPDAVCPECGTAAIEAVGLPTKGT